MNLLDTLLQRQMGGPSAMSPFNRGGGVAPQSPPAFNGVPPQTGFSGMPSGPVSPGGPANWITKRRPTAPMGGGFGGNTGFNGGMMGGGVGMMSGGALPQLPAKTMPQQPEGNPWMSKMLDDKGQY